MDHIYPSLRPSCRYTPISYPSCLKHLEAAVQALGHVEQAVVAVTLRPARSTGRVRVGVRVGVDQG